MKPDLEWQEVAPGRWQADCGCFRAEIAHLPENERYRLSVLHRSGFWRCQPYSAITASLEAAQDAAAFVIEVTRREVMSGEPARATAGPGEEQDDG